MTARVQSRCSFLAAAALALAALTSAVGAEREPADGNPNLSPPRRLELFRKETPAVRLRLVKAPPGGGEEFHKVARGNVVSTLVKHSAGAGRGGQRHLPRQGPDQGEHDGNDHQIGPSVSGASIKKGDRLVELDDSGIAEQVLTQKVAHSRPSRPRPRPKKTSSGLRNWGRSMCGWGRSRCGWPSWS